ncbi:MAG: ClpXP protease specificity-enhancing factor [Pseudomonadota bacterium]
MAELSRRPYLLRAMLDWMIDCGHTPHLIVDAAPEGVRVPKAYVKEGRIVLNISPNATQSLQIDGEAVSFNARFGGVAQVIFVPIDAVLGIYARETGQSMVFSAEGDAGPGEGGPGAGPPVPPSPLDAGAPGEKPRGGKGSRPSLKVVK